MPDGEFEAGQFQGKILTTLASCETMLIEIKDRLDNHSRRIRRLELWQAGLLGGCTVIGWLLKAWSGP